MGAYVSGTTMIERMVMTLFFGGQGGCVSCKTLVGGQWKEENG